METFYNFQLVAEASRPIESVEIEIDDGEFEKHKQSIETQSTETQSTETQTE